MLGASGRDSRHCFPSVFTNTCSDINAGPMRRKSMTIRTQLLQILWALVLFDEMHGMQ